MVTREQRMTLIYMWLFTIIGSIFAAFGTWQALLGGSKILMALGFLIIALTQLCRIARARQRTP